MQKYRLFAPIMAHLLGTQVLKETTPGSRMRHDRTKARTRPRNWYARRRARMQMARESRRRNR